VEVSSDLLNRIAGAVFRRGRVAKGLDRFRAKTGKPDTERAGQGMR
jgi:hypothetical protein